MEDSSNPLLFYASPMDAYLAVRTYVKTQDFQKAEILLRALIREFPEDIAYRESLLEAMYRQDRMEEMLTYFLECTRHFNPTDDPVFHRTYADALRATRNSPSPLGRLLRFYELVHQLKATSHVVGDIVECGCFRGMSSYLLCRHLQVHDHTFRGNGYHIFDSFQGLPSPSSHDEVPDHYHDAGRLKAMARRGNFAAPLDLVRESLSAFPMIEYHPGWIPASFNGLPENTYRFVHIDVDLYEPTRDSLDYFYPRLAVDGAIVSDDYGWPGARKAIDEFRARYNVHFTITTYNQAVLIKPPTKLRN